MKRVMNIHVVIVLFWLTTVLTDAAATRLDPAASVDWPHFFVKRGLLAVFWIAVSFFALRFYRDRPIDRRTVLATFGIATVMCFAYAAFFGVVIVLVSAGRRGYLEGVSILGWVDMLYAFLTVWQIAVAANAYHYYRRHSQLQLAFFRAQLEPHFLFNALNSIAALVRLDRKDDAVTALNQVSQLLRSVLDVGAEQLVPWEWEDDVSHMYVSLQQLRFGEQLVVRFDGKVNASQVPILVLQPLIENAIKHGPLADGETCTIDVHRSRRDDRLVLSVSNAIAKSRKSEIGVGLRNMAARLQGLYGAAHRFTRTEKDGRFTVEIEIPA